MSNRLSRFAALPLGQQVTFLHAWVLLGKYTFVLQRASFKHVVKDLQHHRSIPIPTPVAESGLQTACAIGAMVTAAASATPWHSACLAQVLAAQQLLSSRGIPGQLYLGARTAISISEDVSNVIFNPTISFAGLG